MISTLGVWLRAGTRRPKRCRCPEQWRLQDIRPRRKSRQKSLPCQNQRCIPAPDKCGARQPQLRRGPHRPVRVFISKRNAGPSSGIHHERKCVQIIAAGLLHGGRQRRHNRRDCNFANILSLDSGPFKKLNQKNTVLIRGAFIVGCKPPTRPSLSAL